MNEDTDTISMPPPCPGTLHFPNKPGNLYVFRSGKHTLVTPCGAQIRVTSEGVPIPRVRMSKKDRKRARKRADEAQAKLDGLMAASRGRESEVRRIFVDKLNEFIASYGRQPNDLEKQALTVISIEELPEPVATLQH